jgi:hypothetical protein
MSAALVLSLLLLALQSPTAAPVPQQPATSTVEAAPVVDKGKALAKIRRIYVEPFGTSEASQQLQAMVIASLTECKRLTVTEDKTKADAILKGFAAEKSTQEVHAYGSGTSVGTAGGAVNHHSGAFGAAASSIEDSSVNTETIDSAKGSIRLINTDGDVIWTSTQESRGAKYKGASADVADKMIKQLVRDMEKSEKEPTASVAPKNQ